MNFVLLTLAGAFEEIVSHLFFKTINRFPAECPVHAGSGGGVGGDERRILGSPNTLSNCLMH